MQYKKASTQLIENTLIPISVFDLDSRYESIFADGCPVKEKAKKDSWKYLLRYIIDGENKPQYIVARSLERYKKRVPDSLRGKNIVLVEFTEIDRSGRVDVKSMQITTDSKSSRTWFNPDYYKPPVGKKIEVKRKNIEFDWIQDTFFGGKTYLCCYDYPGMVYGWRFQEIKRNQEYLSNLEGYELNSHGGGEYYLIEPSTAKSINAIS